MLHEYSIPPETEYSLLHATGTEIPQKYTTGIFLDSVLNARLGFVKLETSILTGINWSTLPPSTKQ